MPHSARMGLRTIGAAAALMASASPALAAPIASVSATIVKPVTLTWVQDLDLGTLTLGPGAWTSAAVGISKTGVFSCTNPNVICTGPTQVAKYNVVGTNKMVITIDAPDVRMTNQRDPSQTLTLKVDNPGSVTLTNSGQPGSTFSLGGSVVVSPSTADGTYSGTFNVTVNY